MFFNYLLGALLLPPAFLGSGLYADASTSNIKIPRNATTLQTQTSEMEIVPVHGLKNLQKYFCPSNPPYRTLREDINSTDFIVSRPRLNEMMAHVQQLQLELMKLQLDMIDSPGTTDSNVSETATNSTMAPLETTSPAQEINAISTSSTPSATPKGLKRKIHSRWSNNTQSTSSMTAKATGISRTDTTAPLKSYTFNEESRTNVAVYYGQTPATGSSNITQLCADSNIDIVILSFVIASSNGGPYPGINFGAACSGQTPEMEKVAPGLLHCPSLANDIQTCQNSYNKKVMLSIGGAASQLSFPMATNASTFGDMLWNLFGPPGNISTGLRPFDNVTIDGFDIDNEDNLPSNFDVLGSTLRAHYKTDSSRKYYLSSAPQCPFPDASNPSDLLLMCDFVWVQFYNNPYCQIGSIGFADSVNQWSTALENSTIIPKTKLYIGAPAFSAAGPTAYSTLGGAQGIEAVAKNVQYMNLTNFGGMMFWDGSEAELNKDGNATILAWAKQGLFPNSTNS